MFSTKGRYAIRVMIDLAEQQGDEGYVPLKDIAERQELSKKYLEIIAKDMVTGGLIKGISGKHGGYRLSRDAASYSVGEILELMEETLAPVACIADKNYECSRKDICQTLPMWEEYDRMTKEFFYGRKLTDLMKK